MESRRLVRVMSSMYGSISVRGRIPALAVILTQNSPIEMRPLLVNPIVIRVPTLPKQMDFICANDCNTLHLLVKIFNKRILYYTIDAQMLCMCPVHVSVSNS